MSFSYNPDGIWSPGSTSSSRNPFKGWRILSLDGGGVRGLIELLILERIFRTMTEILRNEYGQQVSETDLRPCDYFDIIGGTSTGGLNAIMLGRLQMTVRAAITNFKEISKRVFPTESKRWLKGKLVFGTEGYDASNLENAVKDLLRAQQGDPDLPLREQTRDPKCRVFVCATGAHTATPVLLRSYEVNDRGQTNYRAKIWEAARATSAAPHLFEPITIVDGSSSITVQDGAMGNNNPIHLVMQESYSLDSSRGYECVLSLGTGVKGVSPLYKKGHLLLVAKTCAEIATNCEHIAASFLRDPTGSMLEKSGRYFRFNVANSMLEGVHLDEWEKHEAVQEYVNVYLQSIGGQIEECARTLLESSEHDARRRHSSIVSPNSSAPNGGFPFGKRPSPAPPAMFDPVLAAAHQRQSGMGNGIHRTSVASQPFSGSSFMQQQDFPGSQNSMPHRNGAASPPFSTNSFLQQQNFPGSRASMGNNLQPDGNNGFLQQPQNSGLHRASSNASMSTAFSAPVNSNKQMSGQSPSFDSRSFISLPSLMMQRDPTPEDITQIASEIKSGDDLLTRRFPDQAYRNFKRALTMLTQLPSYARTSSAAPEICSQERAAHLGISECHMQVADGKPIGSAIGHLNDAQKHALKALKAAEGDASPVAHTGVKMHLLAIAIKRGEREAVNGRIDSIQAQCFMETVDGLISDVRQVMAMARSTQGVARAERYQGLLQRALSWKLRLEQRHCGVPPPSVPEAMELGADRPRIAKMDAVVDLSARSTYGRVEMGT